MVNNVLYSFRHCSRHLITKLYWLLEDQLLEIDFLQKMKPFVYRPISTGAYSVQMFYNLLF